MLPEFEARHRAVLVIAQDDRCFSLADRLIRPDYGKLTRPETATAPSVPAGEVAMSVLGFVR